MNKKVKRSNDSIFEDGFLTAEVVKESGGWTTVRCKDGKEYKYRNGQICPVPWETPDAIVEVESVPRELRKFIPKQMVTTYRTSTTSAPKTISEAAPGAAQVSIGGHKVPKGRYVITRDVKTKSGRVAIDNNDPVASMLRGLDLMEVYRRVADARGTTIPELEARYRHLNAGMQRMNLGNLLRKALK